MRAGDRSILRTGEGTWSVGLVKSNEGLRFSAGWNKFSKENNLELNNVLRFTFAGQENGQCVFDVVVLENN